MLLPDTQVISSSPSNIVLTCDRVYMPGMVGIVAYDKYSDEDSFLGLDPDNFSVPDNEDYYLWKFISASTRIGVVETTEIITKGDLNGSLENKYFCIYLQNQPYYVWYNTGSGTDPAPMGTGIEVAIPINSSAEDVAFLTSIELVNVGFLSTSNANKLTVRQSVYGDVLNALDGDTEFIISTVQEGGVDIPAFSISNNMKYPIMRPDVPDYSLFRSMQFNILTDMEWKLVQAILKRLDLVRRRYPNLGQRQLGLGISGGFEKKFSIEEILDFIYQTVVEMNLHAPSTKFWFGFNTSGNRVMSHINPYMSEYGVPFEWYDAIIDGSMIKALLARQIFEIDTNFNISDQGISISYERDSKIGSVLAGLVSEFDKKKTRIKWQYAPHSGSAVGTYFGFAGYHYFNQVMNMLSTNGTIALRSLAPYYAGNTIG